MTRSSVSQALSGRPTGHDRLDVCVRSGAWLGFSAFAASLLGLTSFLVIKSAPAWRAHGAELVSGSMWHYPTESFGALAMTFGTISVTVCALLLATPFAVATATVVSEVMPGRLAALARTGLELLVGIPSVVFGLIGILFLVPAVRGIFGSPSGETLLTGSLLLAVMILPTVASLSESALRSVPLELRLAARALGLTRAETTLQVLAASWRGQISAVLLGVGRALGETIAVFLVIGRADGRLPTSLADIPTSLLRAGQTLTTKLGGSEVAIAYGSTGTHEAALIALAAILFAMVALVVVLGNRLRRRGLGMGEVVQ